MNYRIYKLFAFDLDGTLLSPDGTVPLRTKAFLRNIHRHIRVTLATGRSLTSSRPYIDELEITTPIILYHGAVVLDPQSNSVLRERRIPRDLARRALRTSRGFPVHPQVYLTVEDPVIYVEAVTPPIEEFLNKENLSVELVTSFDDLPRTDPLKILFIGPPEALTELQQTLWSKVPELTVVSSEREYVEVLPPGISKGAALTWLCSRLQIPLKQVVAVGDQMSDLSMIEQAGLGVAMLHGPDKLRSRASLVVRQVTELADLLEISLIP